MQAAPQKQPRAVLFDSSFDGDVDQVLALAMLFGLEGKRQVRLGSLSTSQFNLQIARFIEIVARFYGGGRGPTIGMSNAGALTDSVPSMVDAALRKTGAEGKPAYTRTLPTVNDTADAVALIRNALSAQTDRNAAVVL